MKRALSFVLLAAACGSSEPPRTEVTVARPTALVAPAEDAGVTSMWGGADSLESNRGEHSSPSSRIDPALVQRVVRQNAERNKACYQRGLAKDATLTGSVYTRFIIEPSGDVSSATSTAQTTMPNAEVVQCVLAVFKAMKFAQPEGGSVSIVYPLIFSPGD